MNTYIFKVVLESGSTRFEFIDKVQARSKDEALIKAKQIFFNHIARIEILE